MSDHALLLQDLLSMPDLRMRSYALKELQKANLVAIDASARDLGDWYFARTWISTTAGPRTLHRNLDILEAAGFRFRVRTTPNGHGRPQPRPPGPEDRASQLHAQLHPREQAIHRDLFPQEARLLAAGYDWDSVHVYRAGLALPPDAWGRILEVVDGVEYEWVPILDEFTWRRLPLRRLPLGVAAPTASPRPDMGFSPTGGPA